MSEMENALPNFSQPNMLVDPTLTPEKPAHKPALVTAPAAAAEREPEVYGAAASFESPEKLLAAIRALRAQGYDNLEAYTPFPIHGIDEALGIKRSKLGWLVAGMGSMGALAGFGLQWWVGTDANRLVIGGKPFFGLPPSVPIIFELTVLFASFGAVFGMLFFNGLPRLYHPVFLHSQARRITDDGFLLAIEKNGDDFDGPGAMKALQAAGGRHAEVIAG